MSRLRDLEETTVYTAAGGIYEKDKACALAWNIVDHMKMQGCEITFSAAWFLTKNPEFLIDIVSKLK